MMKRPAIRRFTMIAICILLSFFTMAQFPDEPVKKINKPYRILTSGKQVTVKSTKNIKSVMVWTSTGHRIIEQRDINNTSYTFNINVPEKIIYLMIQYDGIKPFTEKLGLRN